MPANLRRNAAARSLLPPGWWRRLSLGSFGGPHMACRGAPDLACQGGGEHGIRRCSQNKPEFGNSLRSEPGVPPFAMADRVRPTSALRPGNR